MRLTNLKITNFRSIQNLDIELGETTVFIGSNNAGKTAILDSVRIALTRRWGQRGTGFTEYDVHLATETDDPKASSGVVIELKSEEETAGQWPESLQQDLDNIIQTDPGSGKNFISMRVSCVWNAADGCFQPTWVFLNAARAPLAGASARATNLERFWKYLPVFYLGALRDSGDEFSSKSQFWGKLLKAMKVPTELETKMHRIFDRLNRKLLQADPRLAQIAATLSDATKVSSRARNGSVDLRLLPLKYWDLLSRSQIISRNDTGKPWLPLQSQGQGVQSLSVIFLFRAFVEHLLAEHYEEGSAPILALEEPETHIHPHATRALWAHVTQLPGQKLITTHSPYFVQHVPLRSLRIVKLSGNGTEVKWLPSSFSVEVPSVPQLMTLVGNSRGLLSYDAPRQTLTVKGKLEQNIYRDLLTCYGAHVDKTAIHSKLKDLCERSKLFISDEELKSLETFACRIRGEIFFADRWMIVEGQAEYLLIHSLARSLGYDFDEHSVSLIDAQNNGSVAIFAVLARALGMPWVAVFDGDSAGQGYVSDITGRDFEASFVTAHCQLLPAGTLEQQLLQDGLEDILREILGELGYADALTIDRTALLARLEGNKTKYAACLASRIKTDSTLAMRMPSAFRTAITNLQTMV